MRQRHGFTLVELMIASTLTMVLLAGALFGLGQLLRSWRLAISQIENSQLEMIISERLSRDLRAAAVIMPGSGSQEVKLKIDNTIVIYAWEDQKVKYQQGSYTAFLTDQGDIKLLSFNYPAQATIGLTVGGLATLISLRNWR
jgi:type II secretory pathway pseudopilin PulG